MGQTHLGTPHLFFLRKNEMSKQITPNQLSHVLVRLLNDPKAFDTVEQYEKFMTDAAILVTNHCGGQVQYQAHHDGSHCHVGVHADESLPEDGGIWKDYDREGQLFDDGRQLHPEPLQVYIINGSEGPSFASIQQNEDQASTSKVLAVKTFEEIISEILDTSDRVGSRIDVDQQLGLLKDLAKAGWEVAQVGQKLQILQSRAVTEILNDSGKEKFRFQKEIGNFTSPIVDMVNYFEEAVKMVGYEITQSMGGFFWIIDGIAGTDFKDRADVIVDAFVHYKSKPERFVKVEYDPVFFGGEYSGVGTFVLIPLSLVVAAAAECDDYVELAFRKHTKLDSMHIIHYTLDEQYDENGKLIET